MTLRQLLWMADGSGRSQWAHTSLLCALIANANQPSNKHRAFKPSDFNPYAHMDRPRVADKASLSLLKEALLATKGSDP